MNTINSNQNELKTYIHDLVKKTKNAAIYLAQATEAQRTKAVTAMAIALETKQQDILRANDEDLRIASQNATPSILIDRLRLSPQRIKKMANTISKIAQFEDPIGQVERMRLLPNGLQVGKMRIPIGTIALIYESRPSITADTAALCIKSANSIILKGGSEAFNTNKAIATALKDAIQNAGLSKDCIAFVDYTNHDAVKHLIRENNYVDLLIPRGGEELINFIIENATIPVIIQQKGNCHIFVEKTASNDQIIPILLNAKCQRPSASNAMETLILDKNLPSNIYDNILETLQQNGVTLHCDQLTIDKAQNSENLIPATPEDWSKEYLSLECAVKTVENIDSAIEHILQHSSDHTEAILTNNYEMAQKFMSAINASTIMINASTRLADGSELGVGTEIGISTSKLHAYGPMGLRELTTTKFIVLGNGQIRELIN